MLFVATSAAGVHFACAGEAKSSTLGEPCTASTPCGPDSVCDPQYGICVEPTDGGGVKPPDKGAPVLPDGPLPDQAVDDAFVDMLTSGSP